MYTTMPADGRSSAPAPDRAPAVPALLGALAFVSFYLAVDLARGAVTAAPQPLPTDSPTLIYAYLVDNPAAIAVTAACQLLSVAGLALFVITTGRVLRLDDSPHIRWGRWAGLAAVAAMVVSVALSMLLAAAASSTTVGTAVGIQQALFIAGGVTHVVMLGVFVALTGHAYAGRTIRILSLVAAVPALLSVISLFWYYGNALILFGRLLSMAWTIAAAIALVRAVRRGRNAGRPL